LSVLKSVRNTELSTSGKYELDRLMRRVEQQPWSHVDDDADASVRGFDQLQVNRRLVPLACSHIPTTLVVQA